MRAEQIHAQLGSAGWRSALEQLGVPEQALRNRHGPCLICGGKDRYRFDNRRGRGDWICNRCGAGDGFKLLQLVHGWDFSETRRRVMDVAGLAAAAPLPSIPPVRAIATELASPTERVHRLRRGRCAVENCDDAVTYLASRGLWPLRAECTLRAHAGADYWHEGRRTGRFPALVADVVDIAGELATVHVTYLNEGKKLSEHESRKLMSPLTGREGCAVRLMPSNETLGIAEGIETALAAAILDNLPIWAALNTSLLAKFEPPPGVRTLRIYADRDEAGLAAAARLMERLQGRVVLELRLPSPPAKDWNDSLMNHRGRYAGQEV